MKITIDLIEEAKIRLLLMKINKKQEEEHLPSISLEDFVSMLLATPEFISIIETLSKNL